RRGLELDAAGLELLVGLPHVVARERSVEERADAVLVAVGREEHDAGFPTRDLELDPALSRAHRLVGVDLEAQPVPVEPECAILIGKGNPDDLAAADHADLLGPPI